MTGHPYYRDKTTVTIHQQDKPLLDELRDGEEPNYLVLRRALTTLKELEELEAEMADG